MKILILDQATKKPLTNAKLQLQVRGKDSGYLTVTTDTAGFVTLEDKLKGQQIALATTGGQGGGQGGQGQWIQANDGAKLFATGTTTTAGTTTTHK